MPVKKKEEGHLLAVVTIFIYLEAYPSPSHDDVSRDDGYPRHGKSFVSLSKDEGTQFCKKRRSEYQFRRRIADGEIKEVAITPIKPRKSETS